MPREQVGGRSIRLDVSLPTALYEALEKRVAKQKLDNVSQAVRIAVAEWIGRPELAEVQRGRPRIKDKS